MNDNTRLRAILTDLRDSIGRAMVSARSDAIRTVLADYQTELAGLIDRLTVGQGAI